MPVRFEGRQPLSPSISEAYGASESILRANPVLADAYQDAARMTFASKEAGRDRAFRASQADADRAMQAQGISTAAMGRLGAQNTEAQQNEFQRIEQRHQQLNQLGARAAEQQQEMQGRADLMMLQQKLQEQAFTARDERELNQRRALLADVLQDPELAPAEQRAIGLMLMSGAKGINLLEMRQQATQAKMLQQRAAQYEQEVAQAKEVQRKQAELDTQTLDQRTKRITLADGSTADLFAKTIDQNGNTVYERLDPKESEQGKIAELDFKLADKEVDLQMKIADAESKAAMEGRSVDLSGAKESLKSLQAMRQGLRRGAAGAGGAAGGQADPEAYKSADPGEWPGFDPAAPPPGRPAEVVRSIRAEADSLQADPRLTQEQKMPYLQGASQLLQLIAKPNKTAEDKKRIAELRAVRRPEPAGAQAGAAGYGGPDVAPLPQMGGDAGRVARGEAVTLQDLASGPGSPFGPSAFGSLPR